MRILILGISGMLGHEIFMNFSKNTHFEIFGTLRSEKDIMFFKAETRKKIFSNVNALNIKHLYNIINEVKPHLIINCIGIIKQLKESHDLILSLEINSLFPHKLANFCLNKNTRIIHFSTDCVFSGFKGDYKEIDSPDATDLYGKSKNLGELVHYNNCLTLRTSIVGHELKSQVSLLNWFLAQKKQVYGYTNAIFSGFTTNEICNIIAKNIIPKPELKGLYHLSSNPIDKYKLLMLFAKYYKKEIEILKREDFYTNKSLNGDRFLKNFNYKRKSWDLMVKEMSIGFKRAQI